MDGCCAGVLVSFTTSGLLSGLPCILSSTGGIGGSAIMVLLKLINRAGGKLKQETAEDNGLKYNNCMRLCQTTIQFACRQSSQICNDINRSGENKISLTYVY